MSEPEKTMTGDAVGDGGNDAAASDTVAAAAVATAGDGDADSDAAMQDASAEASTKDSASQERQAAASSAREASNTMVQLAIVEDLQRGHVAVVKERDDALAELASLKEEMGKMRQELEAGRKWEVTATEAQHQLTIVQQNLSTIQEGKQAIEERLDRSRVEADQLREEISRLSKSNEELSKSVADYEVQSRLKESQAIPLYHEKQRLQAELDSLQAHANWVQQEFDAKSRDYTKLQQESRDHRVQLQLQLDHTLNDKEAAVARLEALQKIEHALQDKVNLLSHDVLSLKREKTALETSTQAEILSERKVVDAQKKVLDRLKQQYEDVVRENESLKKDAERAMVEVEKEKQRERDELEQKYKRLLEEQVAEYENKLRRQPATAIAGLLPPSLGGGSAQASIPAITAGADEKEAEDETPLSLTDLYARYEETKELLRKERVQREHWQDVFERLQKEVQAATPKIRRQRQEYEIAISQMEDFQKRLESALAERDHSREDTREARQDAVTWKKRYEERTKEAQELAKQVQALLVSRAGGQVAGDIPTSVAEVQGQNQRLLVEHRRLRDKVTELEGKLQRDTLKLKFDAAESELKDLREDRKKQEIYVERIVQQRDLYRALLVKHDSRLLGSENEEHTALEIAKQQSERAKKIEFKNKEIEGELASARSEVETVRRAQQEMSERLARYELLNNELTDTVGKLERDLLTARSDTARAGADSQYYREKCQRAEDALERSRQEIAEVTRVKNEFQSAMSDTQLALSKANAETARKQSETQQAIMKLRLAESQLQAARSAEARLAEESGQLRAEVARQGSVIDSIRRIEASLAARSERDNEQLKEEIEKLKKELEKAKSRDATEAERIRELEIRIEDLDARRKTAESDCLDAKKALLEAKEETQSLTKRCKLLETQLRSAKKKLGEAEGEEDIETKMQSKIDSLTSELESARAESKSLSEQVSNYQKIAKESEMALADLRAATDELKTSQSNEVDSLQRRIESMSKDSQAKQEVIKELTDDLAAQRGVQEKREAELKKEIEMLKAQIENIDKDTESSRVAASDLKKEMEKLRSDLAQAQNNYESELSKHSEAVTALRNAREQAGEEARKCKEAVEQLESIKEDVEQQRTSWEQEKQTLEGIAKQAERSLLDTREQNKVLHAQIDSLSATVEKSQASRAAAAMDSSSTEEVGDLQKTVSELREIVKFLRSENEMIQAQLENANRGVERERASASVLKRSLDEARAELQALQDQDGGSTSEGAQQVDELKQKVQSLEEQAKLLSDSNKLLREESQKFQTMHAAIVKELDVARKAAEPGQKVHRDLETKIAALEAEKASLKSDLEEWKKRVKSLVSKFNQIDPEEHSQLKKQVDELKKEGESLNAWKKATEEENSRIRNIAKALKQKNTELLSTNEKQKKEIERLTTASKKPTLDPAVANERDELKRKVIQMEKDAASNKLELEGQTKQGERLRAMLRTFQNNIKDLRSKEQTISLENESLKKKISEVEAKVKELEEERSRLKESAGKESSEPPKITDTLKTMQSKTSDRASTEAPATAIPSDEKTKQVDIAVTPTKSSVLGVSAVDTQTLTVPEGGFRFAPSEPAGHKAEKSQGEATEVSAKTTEPQTTAEGVTVVGSVASPAPHLRAEAKPFVPVTAAPSHSSKEEPQSFGKPATPLTQPREAATQKKELSIKEKLMEKKRKLAEALAARGRKQKATSPVPGESKEEVSEAEQPTKKSKKDGSSSPVPSDDKSGVSGAEPTTTDTKAEPGRETSASQTETVPDTKKESGETSVKVDESGGGDKEDAMDDEVVADKDVAEHVDEGAETMDAAVEAKEEEMEAEAIEKPGTPFGSQSTNPFAAGSSLAKAPWAAATTFGQSTSIAPFGAKPTQPATSTSSGAFLNMKPPGSSAAPPMFQFGKTASITLPTPAQTAPPPSPFGTFGGTSVFGGFGSSTSAAPAPLPLFGAPLMSAQPPMATDAATGDEEKMDDGEGEMEAET